VNRKAARGKCGKFQIALSRQVCVVVLNRIFMRHSPKARVISMSIGKREWDFSWSFSITLFDCSVRSLSASLRARRSTSNLHIRSINLRSPSDEYSTRYLLARMTTSAPKAAAAGPGRFVEFANGAKTRDAITTICSLPSHMHWCVAQCDSSLARGSLEGVLFATKGSHLSIARKWAQITWDTRKSFVSRHVSADVKKRCCWW